MKDKFFQDISSNIYNDEEIVEKYIMSGTPYIFKDNEDMYYDLKKELGNFFTLSNFRNIFMIGSAKMGFSINPINDFRCIQDDSDIDMVIIDEGLFDLYWTQLFEFNIGIKPRSEREDSLYKKFLDYFFRGWMRPDYFPFHYAGKRDWFDFFSRISYGKYDKRKITGAIYRNEYFFKKYHEKNIKAIRRRLP